MKKFISVLFLSLATAASVVTFRPHNAAEAPEAVAAETGKLPKRGPQL